MVYHLSILRPLRERYCWRIQIIELRYFDSKFLPLYHNIVVAATVATARVDGGQRTVRFIGGNARNQTSFGRRRVALSQWPEYLIHL